MRCCWFLALFASFLLGLASLAPASAHGAGPEKAKEKHGDEVDAGGEKFDVAPKDMFGKALDLTIWTWVVFLLLLFVLGKYAWKPMLEGLQNRERGIRSAMEEAQKAREEAQKLRDQFQGEINRAHEKVREILDEGRKATQTTVDDMLTKARTEIGAERDRLRREIELARDQALQQLWSQTAQLAALVSSKALRRQMNVDDHRRLVDEAVAELGEAGHNRQRELASVQA